MEKCVEKCEVIIGIAQLHVAQAPGRIMTIGLGSCVGVTLYDAYNRIGGMVHIMLSDSKRFALKNASEINKAKYADTGISELLDKMIEMGADRSNIVAKIAGGAQMFEINEGNDLLCIGERNIEATRQILEKLNIDIISEDVGLDYGRTIELDLENGNLKVRSVSHDEKII